MIYRDRTCDFDPSRNLCWNILVTPAAAVDKSPERVREMFRQIAPRYDFLNHALSAGIDLWWRRYTVNRLKLIDQSPILDICTGTGDLALAIARRVGPSIHVTGSDFCPEMLELARRKNGPGNVEFVEGDAASLPFADQSFQAVTVAFGLRNVVDTDRGLREMVRVCKAGGQMLILEFSKPQTPGIRQLYDFYFAQILPRIGQWLARNSQSAYQYLPESVGEFPMGQALLQRMEQAGMTRTKCYPLTAGIATLYEGFR